jgi:hypothetical protein
MGLTPRFHSLTERAERRRREITGRNKTLRTTARNDSDLAIACFSALSSDPE